MSILRQESTRRSNRRAAPHRVRDGHAEPLTLPASNRAASSALEPEVFKLTPAQRIAALVRRPSRKFNSMVSEMSGIG